MMQEGKPIAFFSQKLTQTQQSYTTMEKELLAFVSTIFEICKMVLRAKIHVYTNHKNLIFRNINSSSVLWWRLFLEDFDSYVVGKENVLGGAFSRFPRLDNIASTEGKTSASQIKDLSFFLLTDNESLLDCFHNLPDSQQI